LLLFVATTSLRLRVVCCSINIINIINILGDARAGPLVFLEDTSPPECCAARRAHEEAELLVDAGLVLLHVVALLKALAARGALEGPPPLVHGPHVLVQVEALGERRGALRAREGALRLPYWYININITINIHIVGRRQERRGSRRGAHGGEHVERRGRGQARRYHHGNTGNRGNHGTNGTRCYIFRNHFTWTGNGGWRGRRGDHTYSRSCSSCTSCSCSIPGDIGGGERVGVGVGGGCGRQRRQGNGGNVRWRQVEVVNVMHLLYVITLMGSIYKVYI